jgi:hypothetical protein
MEADEKAQGRYRKTGRMTMTDIELRYRALATTLLAEALELWSRQMLHPDGPKGQLILKLEQLIAALRCEPHRVITSAERQRHLASGKLMDLAEKVLNDQKHGTVTDSSVELATLLRGLR